MAATKAGRAGRPDRRPRGPRDEGAEDDDEGAAPAVVQDRYPNMTAQREMDRLEHVRRGRAMGLTRKQASRHAADEVGDH